VAVALAVTACSSSSKSGTAKTATTVAGSGGSTAAANTASAPGVTPTSVTLGMVVAQTGAAGPNNTCMVKGAEARIGVENDKGGVNGRKITLATADDTSTAAGDLTASQTVVESKGAFVVMDNSPYNFGGFRYLVDHNIPTIGGGYDGPEWYQPGSPMLVTFSASDPSTVYDAIPKFMKAKGVTIAGAIGYGQSPSSSGNAKGFITAAKSLGLNAPYLNVSVPFGGVDVGAIALDLKKNSVQGLWMPMDNNTNFAIVTAAKQAGANVQVPVSATGYGQSLLDQPTALASAEGGYFTLGWQPVEANSAATKAEQAALAKAGFTGVPGFDCTEGYINADLAIEALKAAGQNPTRQSFLDALHGITAYDAGGLLANKVNLSVDNVGKNPPQDCFYIVQLKAGKFVPDPDGSPGCGNLVH
jgi:branched-chain amino acid transport system substrate-binding protein